MADFGCEDHAEMADHHEHMDGKHKNSNMMADHERGAGHPTHHSKGKMPSQLNPDHGPHHMSHETHSHHPGHPHHKHMGR